MVKVWHVPFHESNFMFRCLLYTCSTVTEPSKYETETKGQLVGYRLLCNSGSTNFILPRPAKVWYRKRETSEQGIKHTFEAHAICR